MTSLKQNSISLVQEALMLSFELISDAILWFKAWHKDLKDAPYLYFGEGMAA